MTIDMLDIGRFIVATLRADPEFKTLTGANGNDPRVYLYYSGEAVIAPAQGKRGYVTYSNTAEPERMQAVGGPVFSLAIWADTIETASAMALRLKALLNFEGELDKTVDIAGVPFQPVLVGSHFSSQENTKFAGIQMQFRFGHSWV